MRALLSLLLTCLLLPTAEAQTIWSRPYAPNQIVVEGILPDTEDDLSGLSGALFVSGTFSLNENIEVAAELPLARETTAGRTSTVTGNPYVGIGLSSTRAPLLVEVGVRLPNAPADGAARLGRASDMGRLRAFQYDELSFSAFGNWRLELGQETSLRLRSGLVYASYSRPAPSPETDRDWILHYDAQLWQEGDWLITGLTVTGRAVVSNPGGTQHHLALSLMGNWDRIQPGILAGASLNDLLLDRTFHPFVGVTLSIAYFRP